MDEAMERIRSHQDTLDCHIGSKDVRKRLARNFFVHSTFALVFTSFLGVNIARTCRIGLG